MKINLNNYEIFIIDYFDGNLKSDKVSELMNFLEKNPDIKEEFAGYVVVEFAPDNEIKFENKNKLKKEIITEVNKINDKNYENYFIAQLENDLSENETADLEKFLKANPHLNSQSHLFLKTKLQADETIIFENKSSLKKYVFPLSTKKILYYSVSIAASILILWGIFFLQNTNKTDIRLAERNNIPAQFIEKINLHQIAISEDIDITKLDFVYNKEIEHLPENRLKTDVFSINSRDCNSVTLSEYYLFINKFQNNPSLVERSYYADLVNENSETTEEPMNVNLKNPPKTRLGLLLANSFKKFTRIFKKNINYPEGSDQGNSSLWNLASASVDKYNKSTNNNIILSKKTDSDGDVTAYDVSNRFFQVSSTKSRKTYK